MDRKPPKRLTLEQFMLPSAPFRIFDQTVKKKVELHWHEFYELSMIVEGTGTNIWNGRSYRLQPGSVYLSTPADFHEVEPDSGVQLRIWNLIFSGEWISEKLHALVFERFEAPMAEFDDSGEFQEADSEFRLIWEESRRCDIGAEFLIRGSFEKLLVRLVRACRRYNAGEAATPGAGAAEVWTGGAVSERVQQIRKALLYIQHHFREPLSLEMAAGQAALSPNYFSERFREVVGQSFQTYVQDLRLGFARSLMNASRLPITEICYASGFNTLSHFERAFKKKFGMSPREARRN